MKQSISVPEMSGCGSLESGLLSKGGGFMLSFPVPHLLVSLGGGVCFCYVKGSTKVLLGPIELCFGFLKRDG